jgi:hypothetical protein
MCLSRLFSKEEKRYQKGGDGLGIMDRKAQSLKCVVLLDRLSIESYHDLLLVLSVHASQEKLLSANSVSKPRKDIFRMYSSFEKVVATSTVQLQLARSGQQDYLTVFQTFQA